MKNKISIIIPVYNVEKYIDDCLQSIINQTYQYLEIILIDDGSTDNSGKICDKYTKKDNRIKVLHQKNSGVSSARNNGLKNVTGDFIMFVDPDDWLELNACEELLKKITEKNDDIVIYNFIREYQKDSIRNTSISVELNTENDIFELQKCILQGFSGSLKGKKVQGLGFTWNKIIRTEFLKKSNITFLMEGIRAISEDVLFYYNLLEKTKKVSICDCYLYHYRILSTSATRNYNKDIFKINDIIYDNIIKNKSNHKNDEFFFQSIYCRMINNFCLTLNVNICHKNSKDNYKTKKIKIKKMLSEYKFKESMMNVDHKLLTIKLKLYAKLMKKRNINGILLLNKIEKILK